MKLNRIWIILIVLFLVSTHLKAQITGNIEYIRDVQSDSLKSRDLVIWLPPSYISKPEKRYPVLYMHDGQNVFDPSTSYAGVEWKMDEIADQLIREKEIPELIIVGIYNTPDRNQEYQPGTKGEQYMMLVVDGIKPMIDERYRTRKEAEYCFTGGSSSGGLISFMLLWEYADTFSAAICMSPAFKVNGWGYNIDYVKEVAGSQEGKDIRIYIDNGNNHVDSLLQAGVDEMIEALDQKGYKDILYVYDPEAEHNEAAWAKRLPEALIYILNKE